MQFVTGPDRLLLIDGDVTIAEYVYEPTEVQLESRVPTRP